MGNVRSFFIVASVILLGGCEERVVSNYKPQPEVVDAVVSLPDLAWGVPFSPTAQSVELPVHKRIKVQGKVSGVRGLERRATAGTAILRPRGQPNSVATSGALQSKIVDDTLEYSALIGPWRTTGDMNLCIEFHHADKHVIPVRVVP